MSAPKITTPLLKPDSIYCLSWTKVSSLHPTCPALAVTLRCSKLLYILNVPLQQSFFQGSIDSQLSKQTRCVAKPGIFAEVAEQECRTQAAPEKGSGQSQGSHGCQAACGLRGTHTLFCPGSFWDILPSFFFQDWLAESVWITQGVLWERGLGWDSLWLLPSVTWAFNAMSSALCKLGKWHKSFVLPDFSAPYVQISL